ncbi:hypothetical protein [Erythrobacter sp. CCH5-A1]|jgi:hypothetical protein|uniref:hypothetical protein n=1 Tax=Erythrobacter sp. CCH5-A1 TaxID=1768792 RepID=UPI000829E6E6|nr:hypothetical protein [Erythrobacter sp. CCH5-A1]
MPEIEDHSPSPQQAATRESLAVFLFAISKGWGRVETDAGNTIPNQVFASHMAAALIGDAVGAAAAQKLLSLPESQYRIIGDPEPLDEMIAYLGLSEDDITLLVDHYGLNGNLEMIPKPSAIRAFDALYARTPGYGRDLTKASIFTRIYREVVDHWEPVTMEQLTRLPRDELIPINIAYEFVMGAGDRTQGMSFVNRAEHREGIRMREDNAFVTVAETLALVRKIKRDTDQRSWIQRLRDRITALIETIGTRRR